MRCGLGRRSRGDRPTVGCELRRDMVSAPYRWVWDFGLCHEVTHRFVQMANLTLPFARECSMWYNFRHLIERLHL